jgi:predicted nucleic acid-binding protein
VRRKNVSSRYVLDSYALIAYFNDEPGAEIVRKVLLSAKQDRTELFISVINVGEIYYTVSRERGNNKAEEALSIIDQLPVEIIDADRYLTIRAARLKSSHSIAYADCFATALAIVKDAAVITGDPEFKKLGELVAVEWLK